MGKVVIDPKFCKGCGYCIQACPKGVLHFGETRGLGGDKCAEQIEGTECVACTSCAIVCPDAAITVYK